MSDARDPYPDALRAVALLIVVLGHWVATLPRIENGMLVETGHILDAWPPAGYFTWIVQVVPLFIFVSAAVSSEGVWERYRAGDPHSHWWATRALGLARPTVTYLAVLSVFVGISFFTRDGVLGPLNHSLTVHLWFLLILLGVQLVLPLSVWADRRFGLWSAAALIAAIAVVDLLRSRPAALEEWLILGRLVTAEHDYFAWINTLFFWLLPQQLGIAWWNGRFSGRRTGAALMLFGLAWLLAAVALGYPPSMVNGDAGGDTNLLPPTLALLGVMWFQVGLVVLFEAPVRRFLQRQHLGRWMAMIGAFGLQLYLWHKLAELPAAWLGQRLGWPIDAGMPGEPGFWIGRLEWIGLCALMVVPVMIVVLLFERYRKQHVAPATGTYRIVSGGTVLLLGLGVSLGLGALPGALIGLPLVALAAWLLRSPRQT
ncbi:acyltransferase family protein [Halomonas daqingensis]|uniref:Acyltransferase family protein n=1 Tax=Billgrantia desiderata TaxID=52021 RepID=A0AAW4YZG8_9GAMM|nr:acyltransferase family protein [Halomonas desiderata]MCE8053261.1 acyltransferase family protein [Halomonas desiderata]SEF70002.1 Acyltransferase family protein [Halomonas desiderata]